MNILGIDTSTKKTNVCIKKDDVVTSKNIDNEITHSEKLLPLIDESLKEASLKLSDMNLLACCIGPGSFTGIRIGIATVKAFAKVLNRNIFSASSLDIIAYTNISSTPSDYVLSIMDAKNSRIYYCLYKTKKIDDIYVLEPLIDYSNDVMDAALEKISDALLNENLTSTTSLEVIGDCANMYKDLFVSKLDSICSDIVISNETISADTLITMAENYIKANYSNNMMKDYLTLDALYVRPSQAERAKNNEL